MPSLKKTFWNVHPPQQSGYLTVCRAAAFNPEILKNFKSHKDYVPILEHCNFKQGQESLESIQSHNPNLLKEYPDFWTNDELGSPITFYYEELDRDISPTTLSYIKVLSDLINSFGSLDDFDIVEIGGGYGGQCKIICDVFTPASYSIIDLPAPSRLQEKYLNTFEVPNRQHYWHLNYPKDGKYDLVISNYALTEVIEPAQSEYVENILLKSNRGYIIKNGTMKSLSCLQGKFNDLTIGSDTLSQAKKNQIIVWGKNNED